MKDPMPDEPKSAENRRGNIRIGMSSVPVTVDYDGQQFKATGGDLNQDSMLIFIDDPPSVGTEVTVTGVDDSRQEVTFRGRVTRHQPAAGNSPGGMVVTLLTD